MEVIVTSLEEAIAAEKGGADRLELVSRLDLEGLTPEIDLVKRVLDAVQVRVRVMVRARPAFDIEGDTELSSLEQTAEQLRSLPVDGIVLGFLRGGRVDMPVMKQILAAAGDKAATFHRAIEHVADLESSLEDLLTLPRVDCVLTNGTLAPGATQRHRVEYIQMALGSRVMVMAGGGLLVNEMARMIDSPSIRAFHVGSAARDEQGKVSAARTASLRKLLDAAEAP